MNDISVYFFRSMQLACFLAGLFMLLVSIGQGFSREKYTLLSKPRWYFSILAGTMGVACILAFLPRLVDKLVYFLDPPPSASGPIAVTALVLFYCTSGGIFCILCGKPRRSLTIFLLILSSSLMSTYLEFI